MRQNAVRINYLFMQLYTCNGELAAMAAPNSVACIQRCDILAPKNNCDPLHFQTLRRNLGLTQDQLARILGLSAKAVQSYEQGWRNPPDTVRRLLTIVYTSVRSQSNPRTIVCWKEKKCPSQTRRQCRAYLMRQGHLCWLLADANCSRPAPARNGDRIKACWNCMVCKLTGRRAKLSA